MNSFSTYFEFRIFVNSYFWPRFAVVNERLFVRPMEALCISTGEVFFAKQAELS
jgi:hypothetical protein